MSLSFHLHYSNCTPKTGLICLPITCLVWYGEVGSAACIQQILKVYNLFLDKGPKTDWTNKTKTKTTFPWGGEVEREVLISSAWYPVIGCVGMVQSCTREGLDWMLGSIPLPRRWSKTGTGFLERWSIPHACQCLRGVWTMPLITCFNFWSALKWSGSWTRWSL